MDKIPARIIIAGGKTGGHLFPGIAIAQALLRLEPDTGILFVGTDTPFEKQTLKQYGFDHKSIQVTGIKGKSIFSKAMALIKIPVSMVQVAWIFKSFKPNLVIGVGGYSSGPVVLAAWLFRIPGVIQEQNSIPGITNRLLAPFCRCIFTSFKETQGLSERETVLFTGNPIRRVEGAVPETNLDPDGRFTLLVTGGSQGAASINRAFVDALNLLENRDRYFIIHQTGKTQEAEVQKAYSDLGIKAEVRAFFQDMPSLQAMADLVICRAGAGTLSEITAQGKPSILIPYPYAADDHQRFNAQAMADQGAAVMILDRDLDGQGLKNAIESLADNPDQLKAMAESARALAMENADDNIAVRCLELVREKGV